jgi:hypothetical protein
VLLGTDDFGAKSVALAGVDFSSISTSCNTTGVLSSVLKDRQSVVDIVNSRSIGIRENDSNNSTHYWL